VELASPYLHARFDPGLHERVLQAAETEGLSLSALLREAVEAKLGAIEQKAKERATLLAEARKFLTETPRGAGDRDAAHLVERYVKALETAAGRICEAEQRGRGRALQEIALGALEPLDGEELALGEFTPDTCLLAWRRPRRASAPGASATIAAMVAAVVSTSSGGHRSSSRLGVGTVGMPARPGPGAALSGSLHRSLGLDAAILGDLVRPLSGPPLRVALQRSIRLARQVGCVLLGGPPVATAAAGLADRRLLGLSGRGLGIGGAAGGQRILPWARLLRTAPRTA
jgi:hypothetical protein